METRVSPLYALYPDTETTILASPPGIQLHPSVWSDDPAKAEKLLDEIVDRMALALGEHLYSTHGESLEEVLARILTENRATIAVAESCTGGLLAERLTNVRGQFRLFSRRRGLLQQRTEIATGEMCRPASSKQKAR